MEKKSKIYFGPEVEQAVIEYNNLVEERARNRIFKQIIYPAFNELVQNIIFDAIKKERPYHTDLTYEDLKHECIVFLYEKIGGFDPSRGKAFSYFNHIGIRWMIGQSQTVYSSIKSRGELEEVDEKRDVHMESDIHDSQIELRDFIRLWAKSCNSRLDILFKKKRDRKIANAIFNLFENLEYIDIYKKKALYILVREQVDVSTHHITTVLNDIKTLYGNMYSSYLNRREST